MSVLLATNEGGNFNLALQDGGALQAFGVQNIGPGTGPNPATSQLVWFVDYVNGSNSNSGLTATSAVKTAAEIKRRWTGGVAGARVQLPAATITITVLTSAPDTTDPWSVLLDVDQAGPGQLIFQGAPLAPLHTGTISTVTSFARTSANGQITITDTTVPNWGAFPIPSLLVDTQAGTGVGWLYEPQTGSSANGIVSPLRALATAGTAADGGQIAINAGDAYQLVPLVSIYMGSGATYRTFPATGTGQAVCSVRRLHITTSTTFEPMQLHPQDYAGIFFQECQIDAGSALADLAILQNCWSTHFIEAFGSNISLPQFLAGGTYNTLTVSTGYTIVDRDFVFDTGANGGLAVSFGRGESCFLRIGQASTWGLATAFTAVAGNSVRIAGLNAGGDVFYGKVGSGNPIFGVTDNAFLQGYGSGSNLTTALNFDSSTFTINAQSSGFGFNTSTGAYVGPTTYTVAHVDASLGAGTGFGGFAIDPRTGAYVYSDNL
jgi:hypothetical protein